MSGPLVVLDAAAFDVIDTDRGRQLRDLIRTVLSSGGEVCCAAVTLAEVCRGPDRTRRAEASLARDRGGRRLIVVPTDERLAKLVGSILHDTRSDSGRLADAHVVAVCTRADSAFVVTADPVDIMLLASILPGIRVMTRDPARSLALN